MDEADVIEVPVASVPDEDEDEEDDDEPEPDEIEATLDEILKVRLVVVDDDDEDEEEEAPDTDDRGDSVGKVLPQAAGRGFVCQVLLPGQAPQPAWPIRTGCGAGTAFEGPAGGRRWRGGGVHGLISMGEAPSADRASSADDRQHRHASW